MDESISENSEFEESKSEKLAFNDSIEENSPSVSDVRESLNLSDSIFEGSVEEQSFCNTSIYEDRSSRIHADLSIGNVALDLSESIVETSTVEPSLSFAKSTSEDAIDIYEFQDTESPTLVRAPSVDVDESLYLSDSICEGSVEEQSFCNEKFSSTSDASVYEDRSFRIHANSPIKNVTLDLSQSIVETSTVEPSLSIAKSTPEDAIDIYEFQDDEPPPRVRAPSVHEDDLFEISSISGDSDVLSVISSAIQSSGVSTESLPYGHLNYEEPRFKTSTPMKRLDKGESKCMIAVRKTSSLEIKKAMKNCGCRLSCTGQMFFNKKMIRKNRFDLWNMGKRRRGKWIQEKLDDLHSCSSKKGSFSFRLSGNSVCKNAWLQAFGISRTSFYRYRTKWLNRSLMGNSNKQTMKQAKQEAILWFGEYVAQRGERPPHQMEVWLPFGLRKKEIYHLYKNEKILEFKPIVSPTTFYNGVWKELYGHVKIRPTNLFTKCTICVKLDRALQSTLDPAKRQDIFKEKQAHLHRVMLEKLAYYRRREIARRRPDRYISLIIDGMDQSKTSLPHFKDRKGKDMASTAPMKTHITAVISHGTHERKVYSDYYQYCHDSNLTLNILMKTLWDMSKGSSLPPVLYIQADNCFRENKNKYVLSFLELLVHHKVFYEIQLSFLHVGHTHEDIDQLFSVFADKLRHTDATTLPEIHSLMNNASNLEACFDISGWLETFISGVKQHTKSNIFRYRLDEATNKVHVYYKRSTDQPWKTLTNGFFKVSANGKPIVPSGNPTPLQISFNRIETKELSRSYNIWKNYLTPEQQQWWKTFLEHLKELESSRHKLVQHSRKGCIWRLKHFKHFNKDALEDRNERDPLPDGLQQMLAAEQQTTNIVVNNV